MFYSHALEKKLEKRQEVGGGQRGKIKEQKEEMEEKVEEEEGGEIILSTGFRGARVNRH